MEVEITSREYWIWLVSPRKRKKAITGLDESAYHKDWADLTHDEQHTVKDAFNAFCVE